MTVSICIRGMFMKDWVEVGHVVPEKQIMIF